MHIRTQTIYIGIYKYKVSDVCTKIWELMITSRMQIYSLSQLEVGFRQSYDEKTVCLPQSQRSTQKRYDKAK